MKLVKIWGGIGNQLFQYYFGQFLALETNDSVIYLNECGKPNLPSKLISFLHFNYDQAILEVGCKNYNFYFNHLYRFNRKSIQLFPFISKKIFVENPTKSFKKEFLHYELFDGYWQEIDFLEKLRLNNQFFFSFREVNNFRYSRFHQLIMNTQNSVAIHIRRGDYLSSKYHINLDLLYYRKAMHIICQKISNPVFFIFSDDILWVKENFFILNNIVLVADDSCNDILDFYLMSLCKHHIIANSTFSWWPAYLKNQKDTITIAPLNWYTKNNDNSKKILKREWILQ